MKKLIILLSLLHSGILFSAVTNTNGVPSFRAIGPDPSCHFDTSNGASLQDALNSGDYELRLVNNSSHAGPFTTIGEVYLRGGYDNCTDALSDTQGTNPSVLDADFIDSVITLSVNGNYILENIKIINGSANEGGGLNLTATDMTVKLDRVIIENNQALNGAGISKTEENNNVNLTIVDSIIQNNTTLGLGFGGGIYFRGIGEVIVYGNTLFTENEAQYGGALYLRNTNATFVVGDNPTIDSGMRNNRARDHGAAIYTDSSTVEITGGLKNIPGIGIQGLSGRNYLILGNTADSDNDSVGLGGAMMLYRQSNTTLNAISMVDNHGYVGGGIYLYQLSELNIGFPENSDCQTTTLNGCNFFINNTATTTGGAIHSHNSTANLKSINFNGNRANEGTVLVSQGSTINLSSSVLYNNGDSGNNGFLDKYALGTFSSSDLNIEHVTAVKNKTVDSFILASNGPNLLNSYNNYFYNPLSGPWLEEFGGSVTVVNHDCQIVDETNNINDSTHNLVTTNAFFNDTQYFIDEANNDYHLLNTSNLIDFVGTNCPENLNLINNNRDIDNQPRTDFTDLGADENLTNDIIFDNGFEN